MISIILIIAEVIDTRSMAIKVIRELIELQELGTEAFQQIMEFIRNTFKEWVSYSIRSVLCLFEYYMNAVYSALITKSNGMKNKLFSFYFVEDILFCSPLLGNKLFFPKKSQPPTPPPPEYQMVSPLCSCSH